jgi:hypothetical protein
LPPWVGIGKPGPPSGELVVSRAAACSQLPFGELAKLVGNGVEISQGGDAIPNRVPSEAIADLVDRPIGGVTRQAPSAARAARLVASPRGSSNCSSESFSSCDTEIAKREMFFSSG